MRTFLKMTHHAMVILLGLGGVLTLFLWANSWGQWVYFRAELDSAIGSHWSFNLNFDYNYSPYVNINTPRFGLDSSCEFAGLTLQASQYPDGTAFVFAVLPWWFLFAIFSLYPAIYLICRRRAATDGICVKCYDLRGSKERCPECGTGFPKQGTTSTPR
jgi:hypothetical protein